MGLTCDVWAENVKNKIEDQATIIESVDSGLFSRRTLVFAFVSKGNDKSAAKKDNVRER